MFLRILKKDLKRKKTMNVIMLLFVILSAMFASAAVNNVAAVTNGIDYYFKISDVPDAMISVDLESEECKKIEALPSVTETRKEKGLLLFKNSYIKHNGKKVRSYINPPLIISDADMPYNYFDNDNNKIESVEKGTFYATTQIGDAEIGDKYDFDIGNTKLTLTYAGRLKGALFSSEDIANPYFLLNNDEFMKLYNEPELEGKTEETLYVNTTDVGAIEDLALENVSVYGMDAFRNIYLYDMIAAGIMMGISIILMITSFIVLRFTVGFTISEEFREIGVMKAVGIDNGSIRVLYIVKYVAIAIVGSVIGFFCSIPLTKMMMKTVSDNMVLGSEGGVMLGALSSAAVILLILTFCYGCTRKVNKLSPIDAVRNGQTGERFKKRSSLSLGRSKLPATGFLSLNDVMSAPKRFGLAALIFTLCIIMMTLLSVCSLTLKSEKILWLFDIPTNDCTLGDLDFYNEVIKDISKQEQFFKDTEKMLEEKGMPGKCSMQVGSRYKVTHGSREEKIWCFTNNGYRNDTFRCDEGYAPEKENEIAATPTTLKTIDAEIGDKVKISIGDEEKDYIITGTFSSFMGQDGKAIQLAPDTKMYIGPFTYASLSTMGVQIKFDGDPDAATVKKNIEKLKKELDTDKIYTTTELIDSCTQMSGTLAAIKKLMMILTIIVTAMIVVLMERSFISKEKSEIALMKAMGIRSSSIIAQHTLRFGIVSLVAAAAASASIMPIGNAFMNAICRNVGDVSGIRCDFNALEVFGLCPAIVLIVTILGTMLTALYTRTIKASDTASIE